MNLLVLQRSNYGGGMRYALLNGPDGLELDYWNVPMRVATADDQREFNAIMELISDAVYQFLARDDQQQEDNA